MIWFSCKQCGKTHGRPATAVGLMVFCECGQGNVVPWESTAAEPPVAEVPTKEDLPEGAPMKFDVEEMPVWPEPPRRKPPPLPTRARRIVKPRDPKVCLNHDSTPTQEACSDCGEGFCQDCLVYLQGKPLCGPCKNLRIRALHKPAPTSQL